MISRLIVAVDGLKPEPLRDEEYALLVRAAAV
jgi:hypothetical protein